MHLVLHAQKLVDEVFYLSSAASFCMFQATIFISWVAGRSLSSTSCTFLAICDTFDFMRELTSVTLSYAIATLLALPKFLSYDENTLWILGCNAF